MKYVILGENIDFDEIVYVLKEKIQKETDCNNDLKLSKIAMMTSALVRTDIEYIFIDSLIQSTHWEGERNELIKILNNLPFFSKKDNCNMFKIDENEEIIKFLVEAFKRM